MAKQYVVTDAEFEVLLQSLALNAFKGSNSLRTNLMIECRKLAPTELPESISEGLAEQVLRDAHRSFHYWVYSWIQEMKK